MQGFMHKGVHMQCYLKFKRSGCLIIANWLNYNIIIHLNYMLPIKMSIDIFKLMYVVTWRKCLQRKMYSMPLFFKSKYI